MTILPLSLSIDPATNYSTIYSAILHRPFKSSTYWNHTTGVFIFLVIGTRTFHNSSFLKQKFLANIRFSMKNFFHHFLFLFRECHTTPFCITNSCGKFSKFAFDGLLRFLDIFAHYCIYNFQCPLVNIHIIHRPF